MRKIIANIGANFGDEGKGLMTDYFAAQNRNVIVVRANGGAQAGHTVVTPDGKRHVFSHIGAGFFANANTFLSQYFICNPYVLSKEMRELEKFSFSNFWPSIDVDPRARVTTVYDMLLNQLLETIRADKRHGSVGLGINATIQRHEHVPLTVEDLFELSDDHLIRRLKEIRDYNATHFIFKNIDTMSSDVKDRIELYFADYTLTAYLQYIAEFKNSIAISYPEQYFLKKFETVIFEGAQGLLLDEEYGYMPNCTPTPCGAKNIVDVIREAELTDYDDLQFNYISRWYVTRHGAGFLPDQIQLDDIIVDETNKPHEFQGTLRFGTLNSCGLRANVDRDFFKYAFNLGARKTITITCLDQLPKRWVPPSPAYFEDKFEYVSYGPTRENVKDVSKIGWTSD